MNDKDQWIEDIINGGLASGQGQGPSQSAMQVQQIEARLQSRLAAQQVQRIRRQRMGSVAAICVVLVSIMANWALVQQLDQGVQTSSSVQVLQGQQLDQRPNLPLPLGADLLEQSVYDAPNSYAN